MPFKNRLASKKKNDSFYLRGGLCRDRNVIVMALLSAIGQHHSHTLLPHGFHRKVAPNVSGIYMANISA